MATNTEKLGLKKPTQDDFYNIDVFNENFQKIDDFAKRKDNPHGVTAEQTGSVPYLGLTTDANAILESGKFGFYKTDGNTLNTPNREGITAKVDGWILNCPNNNSGYGYQLCFYRGGTLTTGIHPYFRAKNGTDTEISEWSTAFLPLLGGKLKGSLEINKDWATLTLSDATERKVLLEKNPTTNYLSLYSYKDNNNHNALMVSPETASDVDALLFRKVVNGNATVHKILHSGNFSNYVSGKSVCESYVGTGTYGASNPTQIPCPFQPKILRIFKDEYNSSATFSGDVFKSEYTMIRTDQSTDTGSGNVSYQNMYIKYSDGIISMYCDGWKASASVQCNSSKQYTYLVSE